MPLSIIRSSMSSSKSLSTVSKIAQNWSWLTFPAIFVWKMIFLRSVLSYFILPHWKGNMHQDLISNLNYSTVENLGPTRMICKIREFATPTFLNPILVRILSSINNTMQWVLGEKYHNVKKYYNVTNLQLRKLFQYLHMTSFLTRTFETVMAKFLFLFYFYNDDRVAIFIRKLRKN